jgi:hexokinase
MSRPWTDEVDSLIQLYPNFEHHLRESLRMLVGKDAERNVDIGMAKDGSGVGGKQNISADSL